MTNSIKTLLLISLLSISNHLVATQVCKIYVPDKHPDSRYEVHNDGTVTDNETGLMWKVCSQGQTWDNNNTDNNLLDDKCTGKENKIYTWKNALIEADTETFASYSDWHLPNIKELASLVTDNCFDPSINETIFPSTSANYFWSASPDALNSNGAWQLFFLNGDDINLSRTYNLRVRLVRFGQ